MTPRLPSEAGPKSRLGERRRFSPVYYMSSGNRTAEFANFSILNSLFSISESTLSHPLDCLVDCLENHPESNPADCSPDYPLNNPDNHSVDYPADYLADNLPESLEGNPEDYPENHPADYSADCPENHLESNLVDNLPNYSADCLVNRLADYLENYLVNCTPNGKRKPAVVRVRPPSFRPQSGNLSALRHLQPANCHLQTRTLRVPDH